MSRRKPRHLSAEEEALWRQVARTARPMAVKRPSLPVQQENPAVVPTPREPIEPFDIGSKAETALPSKATQKPDSPAIDRRTYQRLKRGKANPEARIDLHGMTADNAHAALTGFLFRAQASGKRLVLVITGKGRGGDDDGPIPMRSGVLRQSLPRWVRQPPLGAIVLNVAEAHQRHGGSGAFYVYLRRK